MSHCYDNRCANLVRIEDNCHCLPPVGTQVVYRMWDDQHYIAGHVQSYSVGTVSGDVSVQIKRDGYREVANMSLTKFLRTEYVIVAQASPGSSAQETAAVINDIVELLG
jgi:hypothetical protein